MIRRNKPIDRNQSVTFLLEPGKLLAPLLRNLLLTKLARLPSQHICPFLNRQLHLLAHRHQTSGQMHVVLGKQGEGDHKVVNVVEDERVLVGVLLLLGEERDRVLTPVAEGVQVVRGVITVIEAVAVALERMLAFGEVEVETTYSNVNDGDARAKVRVRLDLVNEGVLCPVAYHEAQSHDG